jgi:hypothetical protein
MRTITVQIGNSDNKLSQREWASFCNAVHRTIVYHTHNIIDSIHFSAPSVGWADWQNSAWVFECEDVEIEELKDRLFIIRKEYKQDSVAFTLGKTELI